MEVQKKLKFPDPPAFFGPFVAATPPESPAKSEIATPPESPQKSETDQKSESKTSEKDKLQYSPTQDVDVWSQSVKIDIDDILKKENTPKESQESNSGSDDSKPSEFSPLLKKSFKNPRARRSPKTLQGFGPSRGAQNAVRSYPHGYYDMSSQLQIALIIFFTVLFGVCFPMLLWAWYHMPSP